jgi:hypothetical protein
MPTIYVSHGAPLLADDPRWPAHQRDTSRMDVVNSVALNKVGLLVKRVREICRGDAQIGHTRARTVSPVGTLGMRDALIV